MPEHDDRHLRLDRLGRDGDPVREIRQHLGVGVTVCVRAEGPDLAAALRNRDPRRPVRVRAEGHVDLRSAMIAGHRRRPERLGEGAQQRGHHRLVLLVVEKHRPVGR